MESFIFLCSDFFKNILLPLRLKFEKFAHVQLTVTCQYILFRDFLSRYQLENCTEGTLLINEILRWRHECSHMTFHVCSFLLEISLSTWAIKLKIRRIKVSKRAVYNSQTRVHLIISNQSIKFIVTNSTAWKASAFGVFLVQMRENSDQENSNYKNLSCSASWWNDRPTLLIKGFPNLSLNFISCQEICSNVVM